MSKLPAIQFYVGDWLRDPVAWTSLEAQGLWLRMMFLMHDSPEYGRLIVNGKPIPRPMLARQCLCTPEKFDELFAELVAAGVPTIDDDGSIANRRMVRDAATRAQKAGYMREYRNKPCNGDVTAPVNDSLMNASTSTSTSTSTSPSGVEIPALSEVLEKAKFIGCAPAIAEKFFDHYDAQGWIRANGRKISNWQTALKIWANKEQEMGGNGKAAANGKQTTASKAYVLQQRANGIKEELKSLECRRAETATDVLWDAPKYKTRWVELKKELKQIAKEQGGL